MRSRRRLCFRLGRGTLRQREGVENVLYSGDQVLASVELVGHWRGGHVAAGVQVPQRLARRGIERQQIARSIGAEQKMTGSGQNSRAIFPFAGFVVPDHFASAIVERTYRRTRPEVLVPSSPS